MSDSATLAYASTVDDAIPRLEIAYDTQGNAFKFTSLDAVTSGSVVNQVRLKLFDTSTYWWMGEPYPRLGGSNVKK